MSCTKYPNMFKPMTIKGLTFKNRVFASPITTNRIVDHGYPTPGILCQRHLCLAA